MLSAFLEKGSETGRIALYFQWRKDSTHTHACVHTGYILGEKTSTWKVISSVTFTGKERRGSKFFFLLTKEKRCYLLVYLSAIVNSRGFQGFLASLQYKGKERFNMYSKGQLILKWNALLCFSRSKPSIWGTSQVWSCSILKVNIGANK